MLRSKTLVLVFIGATALGAGIWLGDAWLSHATRAPVEISGFYLPEPRPLEPFTLTDQSGRPFEREDFEGRWTFLYFGYTYCPDVCPMTLAELDQVEARLAAQGLADVAYLLISVDPERDSPERLREYTGYFNEKFQGATGSHDQLQNLARQFGVIYRRSPGQEGQENYTVDHSSTLVLVDPQARLRAVFTPPHTPDSLVTDFGKIRALD